MCDVYEEAYNSKINIYKWVKHGFVIKSSSQKEILWSGNTGTL